jgi:hypothetical protein
MTAVPAPTGKVENDVPRAAVETPAPSSPSPSVPTARPHVISIPTGDEPTVTTPFVPPANRNIAADKAEVGRILETTMVNGGAMADYDRERIVELISEDTGIASSEGSRRVDNAVTRIRSNQMKAAETARKVTRNASLWIALALLFGAAVATMAAISARWEDDRITFGWGRTEPV